MDRFLMEGCKLTVGFFQAELSCSSSAEGILTNLLGKFALNRINLDLLTGSQTDDRLQVNCLFSREEAEHIKSLIQSDPDPGKGINFRAAVDTVNIFPHKGDLGVVGRGLLAFAEKGIPLYGFCSSLSTLTFITDPSLSGDALSALGECFDLPKAASHPSGG
ncbi:MAG: hypothetical protein C4576_15065 [Desulfobacteraceae bacterium]|nr:MAG: hypothetical protein C4576_15065 [Desulfobacteraceae bacterium]